VTQLEPITAELGGSLAHLAIAWCTKNPSVSCVITGASKLSQLQDNLGALALAERLTPELMQRIESVTTPDPAEPVR
jgi:aryl-alcohol dehydrogenase-like predicted oxidoreductase